MFKRSPFASSSSKSRGLDEREATRGSTGEGVDLSRRTMHLESVHVHVLAHSAHVVHNLLEEVLLGEENFHAHPVYSYYP